MSSAWIKNSAEQNTLRNSAVRVLLSNNIRQECHKARALNGHCERALGSRGEPRAAARHNLAVRVKKALQGLDVLVVDVTDLNICYVVLHNFVFRTVYRLD